MYGGLFGDLPATKDVKEETSSSSTPAAPVAVAAAAPAAATGGLFGDLPPQGGSKEEDKSIPKETKPASMFMPPAAKKQKKSNPLLKAVGAAGTSMAFVPTALKRKRPNRFSKLEKPASAPPAVAAVPDTKVASTSINTSINTNTSITQPSPQVNEAAAALPPKLTEPSSFQEGLGSSMTHTTFTSASEQPTSIEIHEQQSSQYPLSDSRYNASQFLAHHYPPEMTEIKDPYDPYVPNDLLQYWDRKALAKERHELEREAREAFERQQALRLQLEKEREELRKKGDYQAIIQKQQVPAMDRGRGRGRGRGVSNLPAWLVEKQRKEQEDQLGSAASGVP
jgi:hypothetical protein